MGTWGTLVAQTIESCSFSKGLTYFLAFSREDKRQTIQKRPNSGGRLPAFQKLPIIMTVTILRVPTERESCVSHICSRFHRVNACIICTYTRYMAAYGRPIFAGNIFDAACPDVSKLAYI